MRRSLSLEGKAAALSIALATALSNGAHAQDENPTPLPKTESATVDLADVERKIYDPRREGVSDLSFAFTHPAFTDSVPCAKMSFRFVWKAPDQKKVLAVDPAPSFQSMLDQFTRIFDYVWRCGGPQTILGEGRMERATAAPDGVDVRLAATDPRKAWTLHFKDNGGKLLLSSATSPEFGRVDLEYADVGGLHIVSRITIDDPKRPIGKFSVDCRDVKVNSKLDDALFK